MKKLLAAVLFSALLLSLLSAAAGEDAMHEIPVTEVGPLFIGQTENAQAATGMAAQSIHAIVLAGGSAYGLGAANGVMQYLEEKGIGYDTGYALVPLVAQADIYDLSVGDASVRPDAAMGYEAAKIALEAPNYRDGNFGAGCGATVGKFAGMDYCMKSGVGSYAIQIGELKIGAVVVVNALGDVYDWKTGKQLAGLLNEEKNGLRSTARYMRQSYAVVENKFTGNTTICVVFTNAAFDKAQLCKIAGMAHDGYARSINPVHTSADGDSIYAVSIGDVAADQDLVGALCAEAVSEAIIRAVENAEGAYGFPSLRDLRGE